MAASPEKVAATAMGGQAGVCPHLFQPWVTVMLLSSLAMPSPCLSRELLQASQMVGVVWSMGDIHCRLRVIKNAQG